MRNVVAVGLLLLAAGCISHPVEMYPVQGPLSEQTPLPVLTATAQGVENNTGTLSVELPNGESCEGRWSSAAPKFGAVSSGSLFGLYGGALFGMSVTTGIKPGVNRGEAFLSCDRGTTVEAEFYTGSGTANGYGIAKDSDENVYKMLF